MCATVKRIHEYTARSQIAEMSKLWFRPLKNFYRLKMSGHVAQELRNQLMRLLISASPFEAGKRDNLRHARDFAFSRTLCCCCCFVSRSTILTTELPDCVVHMCRRTAQIATLLPELQFTELYYMRLYTPE
jgi:hypothetical protein